MIEEIPSWACWSHAEGLTPEEYGPLCLRGLVSDLNRQGTEAIDVQTKVKLSIFATGANLHQKSLRCPIGGCGAETPMTPDLYQLLSERSP